MLVQGNRKVRYEIGTGSQMLVTIFNNGGAWRLVGGRFERIESFGILHRPAILPFTDALSEPISPSMILNEYEPRVIGSVTARQLRVKHLDPAPEKRFRGQAVDEEVNLFIDPNTLLVVRSERLINSDTNYDIRIPVILDYSDYRNVAGIAVPFHIVERVGTPHLGIKETLLLLQSVQFNQGLSDATFLPQ